MSPDDWGMDDSFGPADPETAAREKRRRERDARRAERAEDRPPSREHPGATASDRTDEQPGAMPPPEQRLPSTPAREPFAQRMASMRRRLGPVRGRARSPQASAAGGGGKGGLGPRFGGRTALGVLALVALAALIAIGAAALIDRVRGDDDPPPQATLQVENVTIPEGLARSQIAPVAREAGLRGSYMKASEAARGFDPGKYGGSGARNLEGFLFPATYELERNTNVQDLVAKQLEAFEANISQVDMAYARSKNLTVYDVLIIASMIEREVQIPRERKLVAAVIYNRLRDGMPLGIDATTRFAVGNYSSPLTNEQLDSPSPYNTRLVAGLPPGPIGNPGLASIEAAAHPAKVDYTFYVVKPGTCGEHNFSSSEADFARDQAAYQQALEEQGGSPDTC